MASNPFDAIRKSFNDRLDDVPTRSFSIQAGVLIGVSILIASLSLSLVARLVKKTARPCTLEDNGIFHLNVSVVTQALTGLYSVLQIVSLSGYLTNRYAQPSRLGVQLVSPLLLYLSLLVFVHSLALEPLFNPLLRPFPPTLSSLTDEWDISHALKRRQIRRRSAKVNCVADFAIVVLLVAPLTATVALVNEYKALDRIVKQSVEWANGVEASRSPLSSITLGRFTATGLDQEKRVVAAARLWSGFWIGMIVVCIVILVPTFTCFVVTLRQRQKDLRRALLRLSSSGGGRFTPGPFDDAASKIASEMGSIAYEKQQELRERLSNTEDSIKRIYFRFCLVVPMLASYVALHSWTIRHFYPHSPSLFTLTLWSSWTFTPFAFLASFIFAFRTFFSRLPVLLPSSRSPSISLFQRSHPGGGRDSASQRQLRSSSSSTFADVHSTTSASSTFHHSRSSSLFSNRTNAATAPSYEPVVEVYRPRHVNSYPPQPPVSTDVATGGARKGPPHSNRSAVVETSRKAVPYYNNTNGTEVGAAVQSDDQGETVESSSQHGSVWKEELFK